MKDKECVVVDSEDFDYKKIKLQRKKFGMTQDDLAKWMNVSRHTVMDCEKNKNISRASMNKLISFLDAKTKEELCGSLVDSFGMEYKTMPMGGYLMNIPYIPVSYQKEYALTFNSGNLKICHIVNDINSGLYVAFEVRDGAMDDGDSRLSLKRGDIAITKEIDKESIEANKDTPNIYVIILDNNVFFRKVDNLEGENKVICSSLNPSREYSNFALDVSEITKIYKIVQRRTNF